MSFRLLCTGDIHLGRRPARLPASLDADTLGPAAAWRALVELAVQRKVDAVALTGDVVDESNRFYEAFSVLQAGVERLVRAGIPVVAVAGNHDFNVLPDLAERFADFRLLGSGGQWQQTILRQGGDAAGPGAAGVCVQGWSFPDGHVSINPLATYAPSADGLPTIALLHCDCDAAAGDYAPVASMQFKALPPAAWLLGHIHRPHRIGDGAPLVLYPGSPVGLDPGEPGPHGAWMITLEPGHDVAAEFLPLAPLRWEQIDLSLAGIADESPFRSAVTKAIQARHEEIRGELASASTHAVGCRLRLTGRTAIHRQLPQLVQTVREDFHPAFDGVNYFIEEVLNDSQPDISLEDLARSNDPAGLLAGRLLTLESRQPAEAYGAMIRQAGAAVAEQRRQPQFASLPDSGDDADDDHVRGLLLRAGMAVLEGLLAQKEGRA